MTATTQSAFKDYKKTVLFPIMKILLVHFLEPLAVLVTEYMHLPQTREEHFKKIISYREISYPIVFSHFEHLLISILPSEHHTGIDIVLEYEDDGTTLWKMRRIVDPPVQNLSGSLQMFDVRRALLGRIIVATSWSKTCVCANSCDGRCIRKCIDADTQIVENIWKKYLIQAHLMDKVYLCNRINPSTY